MSRKEPTNNPPALRSDELAGWVKQVRKYKVITPLFGGGEETQKADSITVVRATEIRGHLRFWWRATRGGAFGGDLTKMKEAEEKIWGSSSGEKTPGASQIIIAARTSRAGKGKLISKKDVYNNKANKNIPVDLGDPKSPWSYVAFPLREEKDETGRTKKQAGSVLIDVEFELELRYPRELADDVEAAIWAWELFGGIGARTRRGFGALQCMEIVDQVGKTITKVVPPTDSTVDKNYVSKYLVPNGKWPAGVPYLNKASRFKISKKKTDAMQAWEYLFGAMQKFRQQRYESKYGLSQWPEANEIRRLHDKQAKTPKDSNDSILVSKFPRAKFGLPIEFNMPHDPDLPQKIELHGKKIKDDKYIDRLASPLILRPLACSDGAVGLAAILEWEPVNSNEAYTPPGGLILKGARNDPPVESNLDADEAANIPPLKGNTDVLQAFLNTLK